MTHSSFWQMELVTEPHLMDPYVEHLEADALSLSWYIHEDTGKIHVLSNYDENVTFLQIESKLLLLAKVYGDTVTTYNAKSLPHVNWVEEYAKKAPAVSIGRFYIYGSHLKDVSHPPGKIPLWIDAATAFGTGEHHTTKGCLLALETLAKTSKPRKVLDMGCGTGILGIAAAKLWPCPVYAGDIDPEAVKMTMLNGRRNQVMLPVVVCRGLENQTIKEWAPFDLIIANILANPLCAMASDIAYHLVPGGLVILSGLLKHQARMVISAYQCLGFRQISEQVHQGWSTLVLCYREKTHMRKK